MFNSGSRKTRRSKLQTLYRELFNTCEVNDKTSSGTEIFLVNAMQVENFLTENRDPLISSELVIIENLGIEKAPSCHTFFSYHFNLSSELVVETNLYSDTKDTLLIKLDSCGRITITIIFEENNLQGIVMVIFYLPDNHYASLVFYPED